MSVKKRLTSNYKSGENIDKLMQVLDLELIEIKTYALDLETQSDISNLTWGVGAWEKELAIEYNPTATLESRRDLIGAMVRGRGATTKKMLINTAEAFSGGEVDIFEYPEESKFLIKFIGTKGVPTDMKSFVAMLDSIKPAHLGYEFEYTYTTWGELKTKTWGELKTKTWGELKVY